jgi:chromosome segregation ATPase
MAEKITLYELDINTDAAVQDAESLRIVVENLKKGIKELKKEEDANNEAIKKNTELLDELLNAQVYNSDAVAKARDEQNKLLKNRKELNTNIVNQTTLLKVNTKEYNENQRLIESSIQADEAKEGSIERLRKQLSVVTVRWKNLSKEERENTEEGKKLTAQKAALTAELKKEEKATGDTRRNVGNYTEGIGKATTATQIFGGAVKTAVAPLALIAGAFAALFKAVQRSEKATESFNKIIAVFKGLIDGLLNSLVPVVEFIGEKLVAAFENPKQAIKDLGDSIKENLINRFKAFGVFGESIAALFRGEFREAAKLAGDAVIQLGTGVENGTDKIAGAIEKTKEYAATVVEETNKAIEVNKLLANSERELLRISKEFELSQLNFQRLAEEQRQIRDDESRDIDERIEANEKLGQILDEQLQKELELAQQRLQFAELRKQADGDTLETQEAIFDAQIKIAEITERIEGQRSEQLVNINSLLKEQKELQKEAAEEAVEILEEQLKNAEDARAADFENRYETEKGNLFALLELEKEKLAAQKEAELKNAEEIGADKLLIEKRFAAAEEEIERAKQDAKLSLAADFAGNIAAIVGEQTALGKAAAIAQTAISTYQGAQQAFTSLSPIPIVGPALGAAAAGAAIAAGLANVKKILAVQTPGGKGGGAGVSLSGGGSVPRSVNINPSIGQGIISREDATNRDIQTSVEQTARQRTVLVEDDVTNAQTQSDTNQNTAVL